MTPNRNAIANRFINLSVGFIWIVSSFLPLFSFVRHFVDPPEDIGVMFFRFVLVMGQFFTTCLATLIITVIANICTFAFIYQQRASALAILESQAQVQKAMVTVALSFITTSCLQVCRIL